MTPSYDFEKLSKLLNSCYLLTGQKITLKDSEFNDIISSNAPCEFCKYIQNSPKGYEKCLSCNFNALSNAEKDSNVILYRCHVGLLNAAIPVVRKEKVLAYLMLGPILDESPPDEQWALTERLCFWHDDLPALKQAFYKIDRLKQSIISAYVDVLSACASYIWLNEYVRQGPLTEKQILSDYVDKNYSRRLTLELISTELGVGKTKLCETARSCFGCTVRQLILNRRMEAAKKLMAEEEMSISHIAETVGIGDGNYFVKLFKAATGHTPLRYKKMLKNTVRNEEPLPE